MKTSSVLILGDSRTSLPVLRSLAKRNVNAGVAAPNKKDVPFLSRYCKNKIWCPSSREDPNFFLKTFQKIVKKEQFDIWFPMGDCSLNIISENREKVLPYIGLPIANRETINTVFDKSQLIRLARTENVPIPKTFFIENIQDLKEVSEKITYPAVIKSKHSWVWKRDKTFQSRPEYVNSAQDLISAYKSMHNDFPFPMIQEYIPGVTYSVGVLCNHSKLRAICCIKQHRTVPVAGGWATFRETVKLDQEMKEYTLRLMRALDWHGVAEVEFKVDSRDSTPKLMEINGRFWGSTELAIASGVDFPYLLYCLAVDGDIKPVFRYKVGIKRRWLEGDLTHLLNVLMSVNVANSIAHPEKWRTLLQFLRFFNEGYDCLYLDDPMPFLMSFLSSASHISGTILGGLLSRRASRENKES